MNTKWHRFVILYILYDKLIAGQRDLVDIEYIFEDDRLRFADRNLIAAEVIYLLDSGLIKDGSSNGVMISSKGIDIIENVLKRYFLHLATRADQESINEYRHILQMAEHLRRQELYHYIKQYKDTFKEYLFSSEIMDRTPFSVGGAYKPIITPNRSYEINQFSTRLSVMKASRIQDRIRESEHQNMERKSSFRYVKNIPGPSEEREADISKLSKIKSRRVRIIPPPLLTYHV